jgi:hypothetical protein
MVILFDSLSAVNSTPAFAAGLAPIQADNTLPTMPYSSADLAEWTARSIAETIRRETESYYDRIRQADMDAEFDRWAEEAEAAALYDAYYCR